MSSPLPRTGTTRMSIWSVGLAIFSMFFGAGNIVFPLAVGAASGNSYGYGIFGLLLTAVLVPLLGVVTIVLYEGDYRPFFARIGALPGLLLATLILTLLGPLGALPRCIIVSFATLENFGFSQLTSIGHPLFSLLSCVLLFLFTTRLHRLLPLLGYLLTPALLLTLACILFQGVGASSSPTLLATAPWKTFFCGIEEGYYTMDLLAAFFFSSTVMLCLKKQGGSTSRQLVTTTLLSSLVAATLLALIYSGFTYLAAQQSSLLSPLPKEQLFGLLTSHLLGPYAGILASLAMCAACLTTEIALTVAFATFLHKVLSKERLSYQHSLLLTLLLTCLTSTLHFSSLTALAAPLLRLCYPALIVLCFCNFLYKTRGWKPVLLPFYGTLLLSWIINTFF